MARNEQWHMSAEAAELYERIPARYILGPWAPLLVSAAAVTSGDRVLDVACGTGVVTRIAAKHAGPMGRAVGIDLNPGMIAVAKSLPSPDGAPVEWLACNALDLQLEDASFDVVLCQQGVQFFPNKLIALNEMRRVLVGGGRLAFSVWNSTGLYNTAVGEALAAFVNGETADRFCASRKAPGREELLRLTMDAGFSDIKVNVSRIEVQLPRLHKFVLDHLSATPVAGTVAAASAETRAKIGEHVAQQLQRYGESDGVTYPEETYVVTARFQ
jgi:ubiquinone/menaquinone biosynthesis C-methylase UbiE